MALSIQSTGVITAIDESADSQQNDVASLPADVAAAFTDAGYVTSGGLFAGGVGTVTVSGVTGDFKGLGFVDPNGALSGLKSEATGNDIKFYISPDDDNIVLGKDALTGDTVLMIYLQENTTNGVVTGGTLWMVQYSPIQHTNNTTPDDFVSAINNSLQVAGAQTVMFDFSKAPSGSNLFMTFNSNAGSAPFDPNGVFVVVTGENPDNLATAKLNDGDTVSSSQGGGPTTLGSNGQQLKPGVGLYFTAVTGATDNYTAPNLSPNEANQEKNIQFQDYVESTGANFKVSQVNPTGSGVTVKISAFESTLDNGDGTKEIGNNYVEGLHDDATVEITGVLVNSQAIDASRITKDGQSWLISGVKNGDVVSFTTADDFNRVLIENGGATGSNITFDIGAFGLDTAQASSAAVGSQLHFYDDGPNITVAATADAPDQLVVYESSLTTTAKAQFADNFTNEPNGFGFDGAGSISSVYTLGIGGSASGLLDSISEEAVLLRMNNNGVVEGYTASSNQVVFTVTVDSQTGEVTLKQLRSVVHPDPLSGDEEKTLSSAELVTITRTDTIYDKEGDSASSSALVYIGQSLIFTDVAPTISLNNMIGSAGTTNPQTGSWQDDPKADTLRSISVALDSYTLDGKPGTGGTVTPMGVDTNGNYLFNVSVPFDSDGSGAIDEKDVPLEYALTMKPDGSYTVALTSEFGSDTTLSSRNGKLDAGGPDSVRTLSIPTTDGPTEDVIFFAVNTSQASDGEIKSVLGLDEQGLQSGNYPWISSATMNVSTAGIGVGNNNLNGYGDGLAPSGADESFVINPTSDVSGMKVFIDNSVGGYSVSEPISSSAEQLYYKIFYTNDTVSGWVPVAPGDLQKEAGGQVSFTIGGQYDPNSIDAVELSMSKGTIKVPVIDFYISKETILPSVSMDLTATITDKDNDTAQSNFSVYLGTDNDPQTPPDLTYTGATGKDAFNFDVTGKDTTWTVNGFTSGEDTLVLYGDGTYSLATNANAAGDDVITVIGADAITRTITVANGSALITDSDIEQITGTTPLSGGTRGNSEKFLKSVASDAAFPALESAARHANLGSDAFASWLGANSEAAMNAWNGLEHLAPSQVEMLTSLIEQIGQMLGINNQIMDPLLAAINNQDPTGVAAGALNAHQNQAA